jgi:hypothetical protein
MWALRRRLSYSFFFIVFLAFGSFLFFREQLLINPTCNDGLQNGGETGVDCGGECSLICSSDRVPVETMWATTFLNDDGTYDVGIFLRNKNSGSSPKSLALSIALKGDADEILYENKIQTAVPLATEFPVVIQRVSLKQTPRKVLVAKEEGNSYLLTNKLAAPVTTEASFDRSSKKSVYVTVRNISKKDLFRFPVKVVLYDEKREPIGVSESYVDILLKGETKNIEVALGKEYEVEPETVRAFTVFDPYGF